MHLKLFSLIICLCDLLSFCAQSGPLIINCTTNLTDDTSLLIDVHPPATIEPEPSTAEILGVALNDQYKPPSVRNGYGLYGIITISAFLCLFLYQNISSWPYMILTMILFKLHSV